MQFDPETFFKINSLSGGKRIQILIYNEICILTLQQFKKLNGYFELPDNEKRYKIEANQVITI